MANFSSHGVIGLVLNADIVVQAVMASLALASIFSWAIIFDKFFKINLLKRRTEKFDEIFRKKSIDETLKIAKKNNNHPLARIFIACMKEWGKNDINKIAVSRSDRKASLRERLTIAMQVSANKMTAKLEEGLSFLAIIGSSAPFVGLFGTVWGILNSFQSIAASKNTSLAIVAPGIAEALLATAIGLFAAIPAVFFYNIFTNKIANYSEKFDNFSLELLNRLSYELDR